MKILYVSMDNTPYGDRSHEVKVAEVMAREGHDVHLVVEREPKWTEESPKPRNLSWSVQPVNKPDMAFAVAAQYGEDYDVGFASSVSGAPILAAWKERTRKPVVAQVLDVPMWRLRFGGQAPWFEQWRPWFNGLLKMDRLVTNTDQTQADMLEASRLYGNLRVPRMKTVYYGIDTEAADKASPDTIPASDRAQLKHRKKAIAVSRLVPYKGFDLAMAALSLVNVNGPSPAYFIVGAGEDMGRLIQLGGLTYGATVMLGGVSDAEKFAWIKESDFGLYLAFNPSIPSQFPMEAVYCGKPCIVTDMAINRERFRNHGVHYVHPFNTLDVAQRVEMMMETPPAVWAGARDWIRENRSFHSHARGVLAVLKGLAA